MKSRVLWGLIPVLMMVVAIYLRHPQITFSQTTARGAIIDIPTCEPDSTGNIDQTINLNKGTTSSFDWAESTGCISRPLIEAWGVTHNPSEMGVANMARYKVTPVIPPPGGATHLYHVKYTVQNIFTISWTLDWLHHLIQGTLTDPTEVDIAINKSSGTSLITHFTGSIHLIKISPLVTLAATHFELKTPQTDENTVAQACEMIIQHLRSGAPYWQGMSSSHLVDTE